MIHNITHKGTIVTIMLNENVGLISLKVIHLIQKISNCIILHVYNFSAEVKDQNLVPGFPYKAKTFVAFNRKLVNLNLPKYNKIKAEFCVGVIDT